MTPRERAEQICNDLRIAVTAVYRKAVVMAIEQAITAAIEEDRKLRPHIFVGRNDRDCELCCNPDRDDIHLIKQSWRDNAIKQEQEACAEIANAEAQEYATHSQGEECAQIIAYKIRARSESGKGE